MDAAQEIEGNVDTNTGNKAHSRTPDTGHRTQSRAWNIGTGFGITLRQDIGDCNN